jgi:hypothetical protein
MAGFEWTVRRSQLITTYGIGAIVAVGDESVMIAGLDRWKSSADLDLQESRLEDQLRVDGFRLPPATDGGDDVPVVRFPEWANCPSCHILAPFMRLAGMKSNKCNLCGITLIPSRFVIACRRGHIEDFPYFAWVHRGRNPSGPHKLTLESTGTSASLRDIEIKCSCDRSRDMDGSFGQASLAGIMRCSGKRPWLLDEDPEPCDEVPRAFQRGGTNVWFPVLRSAISIPPWSNDVFKRIERHWSLIKHMPEDALISTLPSYVNDDRYTTEDLVRVALERKRREDNPGDYDQETIRHQEYEALQRETPQTTPDDEFVCVSAEGLGAVVSRGIDQVMLVKRLREVRALEAFTRVFPPGPSDPSEYRVPLATSRRNWLPAIEVIGEGVFFRLEEGRLSAWEDVAAVKQRAALVDARYRGKFAENGDSPDREISARLLMVHTLAHALINQWSLDSGYPAASLRERLFVSDQMSGLMIYTATSDSAGALGGVIGQAKPDRLEHSLLEALDRVAWCSADPVCAEAEAQGVESLNLAACHSCVLLPEVSCEEMNRLLDRAMLIGTPDDPSVGFFSL